MYDMISGEFRQPIIQLVGGLEHFLFSHILGIIIPTDLFFRGIETTNQTIIQCLEDLEVTGFDSTVLQQSVLRL